MLSINDVHLVSEIWVSRNQTGDGEEVMDAEREHIMILVKVVKVSMFKHHPCVGVDSNLIESVECLYIFIRLSFTHNFTSKE